MLGSPSPDKSLDQAFTLASISLEAALREVQLLSSLTGGKLQVIAAAVTGMLTFVLSLMVFSRRHPRSEVLQAWPSQGLGLTQDSEAPSHVTILGRIVEIPHDVEKKRLDLTDQLNEQRQTTSSEASYQPSRSDAALRTHHNSWHLWQAIYSPFMKVAANFFISSTTQLTALIDRVVSHVQARVSSFSMTRTKSVSSCNCDWHRVGREGWADDVVSRFGWYPWQCKHCLTCSYFRRRR